jgi:chromosome segregation ATPase
MMRASMIAARLGRNWAGGSMGLLVAGVFGCAAHTGTESRYLVEEVGQYRQGVAERERHLSELEARLQVLEQRDQRASAEANQQALIVQRLDQLIAQNRDLLRVAAAQQSSSQASTPLASTASVAPAPLCSELPPEEELRRSLERLRADSTHFRGGLSPAENQAINGLLRRKRALDPANPWDI